MKAKLEADLRAGLAQCLKSCQDTQAEWVDRLKESSVQA
jgi:hypothetical protein